MQEFATYDDVVADVSKELAARREAALEAGIRPDRLALDPGLGFAKTADHNWSLLARLGSLNDLRQPLVVGASRKAFLGALLAADSSPRPPRERDDATTAISAIAALHGAWCVRVHDVRSSRDAVEVARRWGRELS
jgi:dihydropteroate synthase